MRKKTCLIAAAAMAAVLLTACSQKPDGNSNNAQTGGQTASQNTSQTASDGSAAGNTAEAGNNGAADAAGSNASSDNGSADKGSADAGQTYDELNQGEEAAGQDAEQISAETSWSGTYASPSESVKITAADDGGSFSFIFTNSGIGGTARCDVNQGIFEGDDGYVVTFNLDVDTLNITVSNEDDANADDSALSGTYSRQ